MVYCYVLFVSSNIKKSYPRRYKTGSGDCFCVCGLKNRHSLKVIFKVIAWIKGVQFIKRIQIYRIVYIVCFTVNF